MSSRNCKEVMKYCRFGEPLGGGWNICNSHLWKVSYVGWNSSISWVITPAVTLGPHFTLLKKGPKMVTGWIRWSISPRFCFGPFNWDMAWGTHPADLSRTWPWPGSTCTSSWTCRRNGNWRCPDFFGETVTNVGRVWRYTPGLYLF